MNVLKQLSTAQTDAEDIQRRLAGLIPHLVWAEAVDGIMVCDRLLNDLHDEILSIVEWEKKPKPPEPARRQADSGMFLGML